MSRYREIPPADVDESRFYGISPYLGTEFRGLGESRTKIPSPTNPRRRFVRGAAESSAIWPVSIAALPRRSLPRLSPGPE